MMSTMDDSDLHNGLNIIIEMRKNRIDAIQELQTVRNSTIFVLWNMDQLKQEDFFTLADILEEENPEKNIELILLSPGGSGEAGYRIGHTFQQWTKKREMEFKVIIPLYAMSAATILSLGASELVMGLQSQIGPIDPQIPKYDETRNRWRHIPAMTVIDGLKLVSEYIDKIPEMSNFFEEIVKNEKLTLDDLGLLERFRESGKQYGEALLTRGMIKDEKRARWIVERLSDYYKFHGHPIDAFEAAEELKLNVQFCDGDMWVKIKKIRDFYNEFVGQPGLIPNAIVSSAIETVHLRRWRYMPLEQDSRYFLYQMNDKLVWPSDISER